MNIKHFILIAIFSLLASGFATNWTVMVYMGGDNSLSIQSYEDIEEMVQVGSSDKIKIIVQVDNLASSTEPNCRRYLIKNGEKELLENLGAIDMADPQTLINFSHFVNTYYRADKYLLIIWDHGNGWPIGTYNAQIEKSIIYDQSSNNYLGIADGELRYALTEIKKIFNKSISIVAFDACLMAMAEVASEIADCADIMFASEEITPWDGLPYNDLMSYIISEPASSATTLAKKMVEIAHNSYNNGSQGYEPCTFSAIDLQQFTRAQNDFVNTLNIIAKYANTYLFQQVRLSVQTFSIESALNPPSNFLDDYIDLLDLLERIQNQINNQNDQKKIKRTISLFKQSILANKNIGAYLDCAQGISIWFPDNYIAFKNQITDYCRLQWQIKTNWASLLNIYYNCDDVKPSAVKILDIKPSTKNDFHLTWNKSFDLSPVRYDILETKNITQLFDDDCEANESWTQNGFTLSTQEYHSNTHSFHSGNGNNLNNTLTLNDSLTLTEGGLLSFWTYYSTEEKYQLNGQVKRDIFYVEISLQHTDYQKLDSFYGRSGNWIEHRYLLPKADYMKLRFRYRTNDEYSDIGVYIDDVSIKKFSGVRQIQTNYPETTYYFYNLPRGAYYYILTPQDSFGNKGFTSCEKPLIINNYCEPFSIPSPFSTDCNIYCDYPNNEKCDLYIYALTGELIKKINSSDIHNHVAYWDGKNHAGKAVANGIYILLLKSTAYAKIGKIVKTK